MIARVWHGWTMPSRANAYEHLLFAEIFPEIEARGIAGFKEIRLLRRPHDSEVEFITIMVFENWDAVRQFAGEDFQQAFVPESARQVLLRFDANSTHYEMREQRNY